MNLHARWTGLFTAATLLLLPAAGAWAQGTSAGTATKIGVINVRQAIVATKEGAQASANLNVQFAPRQNELENLNKQIQDLQNRLSTGQRTLSQDEQSKLQNQGTLLSHEFQRKQDDLQEEVTAAQQEIVDTIGRKMFDIIDKYARDNGFMVVLDTSAQGSPVVYGASQLDITMEIVGLYDKAYPGKAETSGAKPEPKAAAPATTPAPATAPKKP